MATIGFIGLGNMGAPMAANLVKAGHRVTGFDLVSKAVESLAAKGGTAAASAAAAAGSEIVITMLPAGPQVRSVYLGDDGLLAHARKDALLIDCSTIDVETARAVAAAAAEAGFDILDAPVSGGVGGAEAATLTFMVGGQEAVFSRARPILAAMGRTIVHAGPAGNGQAAKICNNARRLNDRGVRGLLACRAARARGADIVRHQRKIFRPMLGVDELLPGSRAGPGLAGQSRLRARLHRGDDAEGSSIGSAGGRGECRADPARSDGGQPLPAVCRRGRRRTRFLSNLSLHSQ